MPEIDNRVLRHLAEMRQRTEDSRWHHIRRSLFACLVGFGLGGIFLLIAWPRL